MKILISGASGLVGTHLIPTLKAKGHEVYRLARKTPKSADEIQWDAVKGFSDEEQAKFMKAYILNGKLICLIVVSVLR